MWREGGGRSGRRPGPACSLSFPPAVSSVWILAPGLPPPLQPPQLPRATQSLGGALMAILEKCSLQASAQLAGTENALVRRKRCLRPHPPGPLTSRAPRDDLPRPQTLTQKLGTGLVGAERLRLLPVLTDQVEPGRASHGAVELGRDVVLDLSPARGGKSDPEWPPPRVLRAGPQPILTAGQG